MKLVYYPNEMLKTPCKPVESVTSDLRELAKSMYQFMLKNQGVGLSANQIGKDIQLLVADNNGKPEYMFNPKIMYQGKFKRVNEGCLSFPGEILNIKRPQEMMVDYININNKRNVKVLKGFIAHIISHEVDHLRGITFYDKMNEQKRRDDNVN